MSYVQVENQSRRSVLGSRIRLADSIALRLRGFLFRRAPAAGEGLFLTPCRGVHMYGMRFALDVLLVDQAGRVVGAHPALSPGRRTPVYRDAEYALELPCGVIAASGTAVGDMLSWKPANEAVVPAPRPVVARASGGRVL
ncbi:MAG TPA: DUF192 domain-containing protein [Longimicrobiales bacterium]